MNTVITLLVFAVCSIYIWRQCEAGYAALTTLRMRYKIVALERELVMDAVVKRANIIWIKKYYEEDPVYQLAENFDALRQLYLRMIFVYTKSLEFFNKFTFEQHLTHLKEVQHNTILIDHLVMTIEEWQIRDTRKLRISRRGKAYVNPMQDQNKKADTLKTQRQKQKEYLEKKKILHSLAHGNPRQNLKKDHFQKRNKMEEGFDTDMYNLYN